MSRAPLDVDDAITRVARADTGRLIACLTGHLRDVDLADEALQDAFEEAVQTWPARGVPDNPPAWLLSVARRKAIDRLRRSASARRRTLLAAPDLVALDDERAHDHDPARDRQEVPEMTLDHAGIADDQLRMILLCCHPALAAEAQVALTLRLVGGLSTPEIAAAYLVPEATLAQRIVRAKRKISAAGIPLTIPARLDERLDAALQVLYLIFNEGYLSRGDGADAVRTDLVERATTLTALLVDLVPDHREAKGLLALELFHRSRLPTRVDAAGDLVLLEAQDRTRWDLAMITTGNRVLADALLGLDDDHRAGSFVLQAVIAGCHANAPTAADTDWTTVVSAYDALVGLTDSPVVAVNRAVAVAMADGPLAGLRALASVSGAEGYHLLHAARAELLLRAGDRPGARASFVRARHLAVQPAEQRHLDRRLAQV